jgi:hypothetical protein
MSVSAVANSKPSRLSGDYHKIIVFKLTYPIICFHVPLGICIPWAEDHSSTA